MNRRVMTALGVLLMCGWALSCQAGWSDVVGGVAESLTGSSESGEQRGGAASDTEVIQGLKEALASAARKSVDTLGRENGFLKNPDVFIPVPNHLSMVTKGLEKAGQEKLVNDFVTSMNRAAEKAVPRAQPIFLDAVKGMSLEDARKILNGKDDAATQYFKKHTAKDLTTEFTPLVKEATDSVNVTKYLKAMQDKAKGMVGLGGTSMGDIDAYVTEKALDGLFVVMAENEAALRKDPMGQGSKLLQKVFGFGK
jgi:glutamate synthase domain-containing protein 1